MIDTRSLLLVGNLYTLGFVTTDVPPADLEAIQIIG